MKLFIRLGPINNVHQNTEAVLYHVSIVLHYLTTPIMCSFIAFFYFFIIILELKDVWIEEC